MLNQCNFIGHLGADPESRTMQNGKPVVNLRLAVSEKWRDKNSGEQKESTTWVPIVIFSEGLCKVAEQYLKKGSKIYVSGKLAVRKWQDQSGNDRYSTEIVLQGFNSTLTMLDSRSSSEGAGQGDYGASQRGQSQQHSDNSGSFNQDMDDDIPW